MTIKKYFRTTREPVFAFVVTLPLLLLYNLSYIFRTSSIRNGVDFVTRFLFRYTGYTGFLMVNGGLLLASVVAGFYLKKKGKLSLKIWGIVTLEGLFYGFMLGKTVVMLMNYVPRLGTSPGLAMSPVMDVLMAAGAGYHEELIFRLLPLGLALWLLPKLLPGKAGQRWFYITIVTVIESVLFSLAHFMGVESFSWMAFWYRFFSGIIFSILLISRGFTSAAYAHFLYDVMVMLF